MDVIEEEELREALQHYGHIKGLEINRHKNYALVEYEKLESAREAITDSLYGNRGGRGGLLCGKRRIRITVETRKERGERQLNRPRGGGPGQGVNGGGDGRGSYRGRGGGGPRGGRGFKV